MFEELDGLLGYRLRRAQGAMHRDYMAAVPASTSRRSRPRRCGSSTAIAGVSQVSVAAALGMDRATMMAIVDRLEERGLVIRKRSTHGSPPPGALSHARPVRDILRKVKARIAKHEERFKSLFTAAELQALLAALQKFQDFK